VPERGDRQERKQTLIMTTTSLQGTPIDGAVALVTGGHRGFGRALVDELLGRGATKIYATSRSPQPRRDERIVPIVLDVTDEGSVTAAAQAAHDVPIVVNKRRHRSRDPGARGSHRPHSRRARDQPVRHHSRHAGTCARARHATA
jgi:hypothetical protein